MSARKAGGYAARQGDSPTQRRAADLPADQRPLRSVLTWPPVEKASACKPNRRTGCAFVRIQGDRPPALSGGSSRARRAEAVSPEVAPSDRTTALRTPEILFNPVEGLSMEKPARALLRPPSKFVPLGQISRVPETTSGQSRKPLIQRMYTLCEVTETKRQSVPLV